MAGKIHVSVVMAIRCRAPQPIPSDSLSAETFVAALSTRFDTFTGAICRNSLWMEVVGLVRIELTTSSLSVTRSNRLSYSPAGVPI